jgi:hypothetical protein
MKSKGQIFIFILLISCMNDQIQYEYADGNGNRYVIRKAALQYIPVTPAESSSGTYSGGDPAEVSLSSDQFKTLQVLLEDAISQKRIHIEKRVMLSGKIVRTSSSENKAVLIAAGAPEMKKIEEYLKKVLGR